MQRWAILLALTLARVSMGLQFQSIAALSPHITATTGLSLTGLGALMGAYLLPGAVAALFGGWAGQRWGDIRTAQAGLTLMVIGGVAGACLPGFEAQLAARVLAGLGAVALNVMLGKMAGDWFQGRPDLPLAMGLLVSSWPAGLALAMLVLPVLAQSAALWALLLLPAVLCAMALGLLTFVWRAPPEMPAPDAVSPGGARMTWQELRLVINAGVIWGLYNVGFIAAISWSADRLAAAGAAPVAAATAASLVGWAAIVSVAAGGWIARGLARPDIAALGCFTISGAALALFALGPDALVSAPLFLVALGLCLGPAAAMIMTLPVTATRPSVRALAMGLYMAIYYALMALAPPILGALRGATQSPAAPLLVAAVLMALCVLLWAAFRVLERGGAPGAAVAR